MKTILLAAAAACAVAAPANAATIIETVTVDAAAPQSATLSFGKFNPLLGTLNSVSLTFDSALNASGTLTNNSLFFGRYFLLTSGGIASLSGNGFNMIELLSAGASLIHVARDMTMHIGPYADAGSKTATLTSNLGAFIGSGAVPFDFSSASLFAEIGLNGSLSIVPLIGGSARLTYDYTPNASAVPEPASWAMLLLGVGAIGGAMRRRRAAVTTTVRYA